VEGRAQQRHLHEVVEVSGLQRGVLAIVGEAEELARLGPEIAVALQLDQGAHRQDGGGGTAIVDAERGQLVALRTLALGVGDPATGFQAEEKVTVNERSGDSLAGGSRSARSDR
jgi:hypothetical protein